MFSVRIFFIIKKLYLKTSKPEKKTLAEKNNNEAEHSVSPQKKHDIQQTSRRVFLDPSSPPVRSIVRVVIITLVLLAVFDFAKTILSSLTKLFFVIVLAVFFAYLLDPLVKMIRVPFKERGLERLMPRALAIVVAYLLVFAVLGVGISYLAPRIGNQAAEFAKNVPQYSTSIQSRIVEINERFDRLNISEEVQVEINKRIAALVETVGGAMTSFVGNFALNFMTNLPWLVLIPILAFFFMKDVNNFRLTVLRAFPPGKWRSRAEAFLLDVNKTLASYTRAQLISCVLIGTVCTIGFYFFGLNYALLLGIMAGILEFIPLIGPLTVAIVSVTVAGLQSPWKALYVAIFLLILRLTHDYVTYPRIVRGGIHLHPVAIILSVLAGEQVAGIPGVFLSIPIVAILTVIYKHILQHYGSSGFLARWLEPREEEKEIIENI